MGSDPWPQKTMGNIKHNGRGSDPIFVQSRSHLMSGRWILLGAVGLAVVASMAGSGCQTLHDAGLPGMEPYLKEDPAKVAEERSNREKFLVDRDHKALYWLLAHKISNGMQLAEVESVFGEPGEYTTEFTRTKFEGIFQTTDSAYRWGPDNKGFSAIVFFRDGHVINFNPKDFVTP